MVSLHDKKDPVVSLEDLCVRHVCKNLNSLTFFDGSKQRWCFPYPEFYISVRPAQKILIQLCKRNALDDDRMCLFSPEFLNLTSPIIKEVSVSSSALRVLKEFRLSGLSAVNLPNVNLNSLLGCLGEWTVKNLISLNVTGTSILSGSSLPILAALGRFKSLEIVADDLPNLRFLNISRTRVNDIRPLLSIRDRLTGLVMHRLELEKREEVETLLHTIVQMHKLQFLDASDRHGPVNLRFDAVETLCSGAALPELTHIDLSGNQFGLRFEDAR
ncbi:unnamed protein product [Dicrocoelium dendriticum]|nr:unnamed protein product [Dicrocoelium dendriticum]